MQKLFTQRLFSLVLKLGLVVIVPLSLHANRLFNDDVIISRSLKVNGPSHLFEDTTIGTPDTSALFATYGNFTCLGNEMHVNEKNACKHIFGIINNFNPQESQIAFKFDNTAAGNHGALIRLHLSAMSDTHAVLNGTSIPITTIVKQFYLHPNDATKCLDIDGISQINEEAGALDIEAERQLHLLFRKNNTDRMCVGLYAGTPESFYSKTGTYFFGPGTLFYEIFSCNIDSTKVTASKNLNIDDLNGSIQSIIQEITSNPAEQEALATAFVDLGPDFLAVYHSLDLIGKKAVLQALFDNLTMSLKSDGKINIKPKDLDALMKALQAKQNLQEK